MRTEEHDCDSRRVGDEGEKAQDDADDADNEYAFLQERKEKFVQEREQARRAHLAVHVARTVPALITIIEAAHASHCAACRGQESSERVVLSTSDRPQQTLSPTNKHSEPTRRDAHEKSDQIT